MTRGKPVFTIARCREKKEDEIVVAVRKSSKCAVALRSERLIVILNGRTRVTAALTISHPAKSVASRIQDTLISMTVSLISSVSHFFFPSPLSVKKATSNDVDAPLLLERTYLRTLDVNLISDRASYVAIFVHPFRYYRFTTQFAVEGTSGRIRLIPLRESLRKFALVIGPRRTGNDSRGSNACSFPSRVSRLLPIVFWIKWMKTD